VKIKVDRDKCEGHSRCYSLAPDLVDVDDLGNAFELTDGEVPAGLEDRANLIVDNCPEFAIEIVEG
jgi:ferredoxin|tara:strand:- start:1035 stop:1232 length:198 start_codon:yes stop_codon:yes gene_type:complete